MKLPTMTQTYKDGVLSVYSIKNISEPGDRKVDKLVTKYNRLRFDIRTVGMNRFWNAMQNKIEIEELLRTPRIMDVTTQDIVLLRGYQYKIEQIQYLAEEPRSMDLSLRRLETEYEYD